MRKPVIRKLIHDTGLSATDRVTSDDTPTLSGRAKAGSTVTIYDNGKVIGTVTANAAGKWKFTTKALKNGEHDFTVRATLAYDVSPVSRAFKTVIDQKAPHAPTLALDAASDSGASPADGITGHATLVLAGNAEAGARVTVSDGGTVLGVVKADAAGKWMLTTASLSDGIHQLTATATDRAGNVSPVSLIRTVTVDTVAPAAPATPDLAAASDSGVSNIDNLTNDATPTLTGTAEAGATVTIREGATVVGTAVADGSGNWSVATAALADGVHDLTATATDAAGNQSAASGGLSVTIDTIAPGPPPSTPDLAAVSDSGLSDSDNITSDTSPIFSGTAPAGASVLLKEGATVLGTATADANGDWTIASPVLAEGLHSITATIIDAAGNENPAAAALAVTVDTGTPAPTITGFTEDTGTTGDGRTIGPLQHLTGTAEANSTVTIFDGATPLGTAIADGSGAWSFDTAVLGLGTHSFTATAVDLAGNASGVSPALAAIVETRVVYDLTFLGPTFGAVIQGDAAATRPAAASRRPATSTATASTTSSSARLVATTAAAMPARPMSCSARPPASARSTGPAAPSPICQCRSSFTAAEGFIIQGDAADDQAGWSVSSAGDVNGDGFDDLIVGAQLWRRRRQRCRRGLCRVRQGRRLRHGRSAAAARLST